MISYIVTIRAGGLRYISREQIREVYDKLSQTLKGYEWSTIIAYELDKEDRWHLHTLCKGPRIPYLKGFSKYTLYVHFQPVKEAKEDKKKVIAYISKEEQNLYKLDQNDWHSQARYNYLFQD